MQERAGTTQTVGDDLDLEGALEEYRPELVAFCYRMLGSSFEAEDAVQEAFVRAWKSIDGFEGRSTLRSWLYRIATNVCLDQLNGRKRRALPMEMSGASTAETWEPSRLPEQVWLQPMPDGRVMRETDDPSELAAKRDSVRLAFIAALQHLPPRQRAVLILRDVLRWKASEVAELLETTVVSVNSALQRAHATLAATDFDTESSVADMDDEHRALLDRYIDAFERYDVESFVALLHEDAMMTMPPYSFWLRGRDQLGAWWVGGGSECHRSRVVRIDVNGMPGIATYRPNGPGGVHQQWSIQIVEVSDGRITGLHAFLDPELFEYFGLPARLES